ncbi:MAG: winged helix-turn-helix domain-containing protein [Thermoplasmataceae archaeon]
METEKNWNTDHADSFIQALEEIRWEVSKLLANWSISRNARVFTISGKQAKFDYVMQNLRYPSHIVTVKALDESDYSVDPLLDFIMDSLDAVAWRYLIITHENMERDKLEFCENHGAIVYSLSQLMKIIQIRKMKNSAFTGKFESFPQSVIPDSLSGTLGSSEIKNTLANIMKAGRKRRDRSEIIDDILYWSNQYDGILITRLVYKTNLNHKILHPILEEMCRKNVIQCNNGDDGRKYYRITESGLKYLNGRSGP